MTAAIVRLDQLTVRYGSFTAVDRLDLELRPGELFGLLGPNGAGKSSTLRVLIGQRPPTSGQRRASSATTSSAIGRRSSRSSATCPTARTTSRSSPAGATCEFFAGLYDVPAARVDECLELVELERAADVPGARLLAGHAPQAAAGAGPAASAAAALSR